MVSIADLPIPEDGKLADNITYFARALRSAGMRVGTKQVLDAIEAIQAVGFSSKADYYYSLRAVFVTKAEDLPLFTQVFRLFWRDPNYLEHMMGLLRPLVRGVNEAPKAKDAEKRASEALLDGAEDPHDLAKNDREEGEEIEFDSTLTFSSEEKLKSMDFEQMSSAEAKAAERMISRIELDLPPRPTRRMQASIYGHDADWRRTLRRSMKRGGEMDRFEMKKRREEAPNLVVLCDISGSMSAYSRMVLHLVYRLANQRGAKWPDMFAFTFGTRLTNITRSLKSRDVDEVLRKLGTEVKDWEGGTRIADCLHDFNKNWSRRVMGSKAVVLLITDGLDQGDGEGLRREMERLQLSAGRVIWLNPLFRWDGFAPKARGVRAMLPYVDCFRAGHNVQSLEGLADVLQNPFDRCEKDRMMRLMHEG